MADVSSLLQLLSELRTALVASLPEIEKQVPEVEKRFLQLRKQLLHAGLEKMEETNPGLAARIQKQIDDTCLNYPFDYD